MLGISLRYDVQNEEIRRQVKVEDVIKRAASLKWPGQDMLPGKIIQDGLNIMYRVHLDCIKEL